MTFRWSPPSAVFEVPDGTPDGFLCISIGMMDGTGGAFGCFESADAVRAAVAAFFDADPPPAGASVFFLEVGVVDSGRPARFSGHELPRFHFLVTGGPVRNRAARRARQAPAFH